MFTLPVSCWRSDSGVSKRKKKKRGADFVIAVFMLLFVGRASLSKLWNRLCRPRERVQLIALALFSPQIATLTSITTI